MSRVVNAKSILERSLLVDVIPLSTPYNVTISVGNVCDFKCVYCLADNAIVQNAARPHLTTLSEFEQILAQLKEFDQPVKQITFVSQGETILNKNLPDMIHLVKENHVAKSVKIITNANALTEEYSDRLLKAGLDILKISLQGLSEERYREICKPPASFSFEKFKKQIAYFYHHRGNCKVHIKIIDIALQKGEEELFYNQFRAISDQATIESCIDESCDQNKYGFYLKDCKICPTPFYYMFLDVWGNVYPCCVGGAQKNEKYALGNIRNTTLKRLWQNNFQKLQIDLLNRQITSDSACWQCTAFQTVEKMDNILDDQAASILNRYQFTRTNIN